MQLSESKLLRGTFSRIVRIIMEELSCIQATRELLQWRDLANISAFGGHISANALAQDFTPGKGKAVLRLIRLPHFIGRCV